MSAPFRLGLIGGGRMGRTHLRALEGSAQVTVVAVAEPFEARRRSCADRAWRCIRRSRKCSPVRNSMAC